MTYLEFTTAIRSTLWPDLEAEEHVVPHDRMIVDGLIELQRVVSCLRENHRLIVPFCSTYFERGLTVFEPPSGYQFIKKLYTLADDFCPINYEFTSDLSKMRTWVARFGQVYELPAGDASLPAGVIPASSDRDRENGFNILTGERVGRSDFGVWTIHNDRIYVAPWIQSTERIVVEYSGIRRSWLGETVISDDPSVLRAVSLWVKKEHVRMFDADMKEYEVTLREWQQAQADLIIDCRQRQEGETVEEPIPWLPTTSCTSCDTVYPCDNPESGGGESQSVFAIVSDIGPYSTADSDLGVGQDIEAMIRSWSPEFVVSCGDTRQTAARYSTIFETYYTYYGSLRNDDMLKNKFWTCLGNHDDNDDSTDDGTAREEFVSYFKYPNNGRYWDIQKGWCHLFFISSESDEPDGRTYTGKQAIWLQKKLAVSKAKWKLVFLHHPPYANSDHQTTTLRWPFGVWGANAVFSGHEHDYERFEIAGTPYFICGWSQPRKAALTTPGQVGTQYQDGTNDGALHVTATSTMLLIEAVATDGTVVDSLTLGTPSPAVRGVSGEVPSSYTVLSAAVPTPAGPNIAYGLGQRYNSSNGQWEFLFPDGLWKYLIPRVVDGVSTMSWSDGTST